MKKLFKSWLSSVCHLFSFRYLNAVGRSLLCALPCIAISLGIFGALCRVACLNWPHISLFARQVMHLVPPLVAMVASPFYVPFLVSCVKAEEGESTVNWLASIWWSCLVYGIIVGLLSGLYWVCTEGTVEMLLWFVALMVVCAPFILIKIFAFPIASIAAVFAPMSHATSRQLWRHARVMTFYELGGIAGIFLLSLPLSYASFHIADLLQHYGVVAQLGSYMIIHAINILSWEVCWVLSMVFYQQRKSAYIA